MTPHTEFADRLKAILEESRQRSGIRRQGMTETMAESDRREQQFFEIARRCFREVVLPRLETLAGVFPNASPVERSEDPIAARMTFRSTNEFPVGADLSIRLGHDREIREMGLTWKVEILPILMDYEREASWQKRLDELDMDQVGTFLEERVLQFTRDYLKIHDPGSPYMQSSLVMDPVCGMKFSPFEAACMWEHEGRTYYFCAESCRERFRSGLRQNP
jgi:YHS domain-containing protein